MKKIILLLGGVLFLSACQSSKDYLTHKVLKPAHPFSETEQPVQPDYNLSVYWASLPSKKDNADLLPIPNPQYNQIDAPVDVFFIHPTTYLKGNDWNQQPNDSSSNDRTDWSVLPGQAGVFNSCCRIYAPRYRQAVFYSFLNIENGQQARALAYQDIETAFTYYIEHYNNGRPFILAGHSQGTEHGLRLLESKIANTSIEKQMIAAYLIGRPLPIDKFDGTRNNLTLCKTSTQTQCTINWNSVSDGFVPSKYIGSGSYYLDRDAYESNEDKALICVNPLTWKADEGYASRSLNMGGIRFSTWGAIRQKELIFPTRDVGITDAQCKNGFLYVSPKKRKGYGFTLGKGNYHIYDYAFFHMNIRENAQVRINAYLGQQ